jgi:hypothetical protein
MTRSSRGASERSVDQGRLAFVARAISLGVLLALAGAIAGCGGGSTQTVTVSTPASGVPVSSASTTPAQQLRTYLASMVKAEREWNHAQTAWGHADHGLTYQDTAPWPAVGRKLVKVRKMFDRSAVYVQGIAPPAGLAKAHHAWLTSIQLTSALVDNYVSGFKDKDVSTVYRLDNGNRLHQIGTLRTGWRLAVLARSKELHVHVTKALGTVGTGY